MEGMFWMRGRRCLPKQEHKSLQREGRVKEQEEKEEGREREKGEGEEEENK